MATRVNNLYIAQFATGPVLWSDYERLYSAIEEDDKSLLSITILHIIYSISATAMLDPYRFVIGLRLSHKARIIIYIGQPRIVFLVVFLTKFCSETVLEIKYTVLEVLLQTYYRILSNNWYIIWVSNSASFGGRKFSLDTCSAFKWRLSFWYCTSMHCSWLHSFVKKSQKFSLTIKNSRFRLSTVVIF